MPTLYAISAHKHTNTRTSESAYDNSAQQRVLCNHTRALACHSEAAMAALL